MNYQVIRNENLKKFVQDVNAHMEDGWMLTDGFFVSVEPQMNDNWTSVNGYKAFFHQPMIKTKIMTEHWRSIGHEDDVNWADVQDLELELNNV